MLVDARLGVKEAEEFAIDAGALAGLPAVDAAAALLEKAAGGAEGGLPVSR